MRFKAYAMATIIGQRAAATTSPAASGRRPPRGDGRRVSAQCLIP
ncbi:hypothetical protein [Halomonas halophila]